MDINFIERKLSSGERCIAFVEAGLVEGWLKTNRILALVERDKEFGLFVLCLKSPTALDSSDILFNRALPIRSDFKYIFDTSSNRPIGGEVPIKITSGQEDFIFEVSNGSNANKFFSKLKQALQDTCNIKVNGLPSSFSWLEKYNQPTPNISTPSHDCESAAADMFDPLRITISADSNETKKTNNDCDETDWPWSRVIQPNAQKTCPVVSVSEAHANSSTNKSLGFEDNFTDMARLTVRDNDSMSMSSSITSLSSSTTLQMSKSLDDLSDALSGLPSHIAGVKPVGARDLYIKAFMKNRESEFSTMKPMSVFCGTWNVNGQQASVGLHPWLAHDEDPPDVYAIGFQELDLSKEAFIFNESAREEDWYKQVTQALHPQAKYRKVRLIRLVGMMLIVFIQDKHVPFIADITSESVGTGLMGRMGNKGGVAVRFRLYNTTICFVNTHLAAHVDEYERRNQDFRDIMERLSFGKVDCSIKDHDMVFWLGDLNYRISDLDSEKVKYHLTRNEYDVLLHHDQLYVQMQQKRVFQGFYEGEINFAPTYKYDPGTDNWDSSEKNRPPAWCDRLLWRGDSIQQLQYRSHPILRISDHKPVSAIYSVGVKVIDWPKHKRVFEDVMKKLDRLENEFLPQVSLDKVELKFEKVKFIEPQSHTLTIANTGQVPVQFEFINKLDDQSYCKPWLNIKPHKGCIMSADSIEVEVEVYVNKETAPKLNSGDDNIEDILVLHLDGGKDFFISVSGDYIPSCFGSSMEALVHMYGPIREVPTAQLIDLEHLSPLESPISEVPGTGTKSLDIPKEIWRLVDHIYNNGMQEEDLYQQPGLHSEIQKIRDSLDTGLPEVIPGSIHSISEALLVLLDSLSEPVIPYNYYQKCLDHCTNYPITRQLISVLPPIHRNVFRYICAFLRKLLEFTMYNNLDVHCLASLFGAVILRAPLESRKQLRVTASANRMKTHESEKKKTTFMSNFLINDDWLIETG
ncbi:inositol polyphosphate 5-phosphatase OCRL-like isoform X2 [Tubulanus polymorphus]|uniref:inositol polyphosphate 5-phosphatase OCRL-like isoform X2 n=1 Tax=Tubulanus polymorphus TaxID=672921 RepID=UPI003DA49EA7